MTVKTLALVIVCCAAVASPLQAFAQAADPALATIESLDKGLLEVMKSGKSAGVEGRFRKLLPVVERTFDLPTMTRFAVGGAWSGYSAAEQSALTRAYARLAAANLAHNFDSYDGEQFKINPAVQTRGPDKLVRTQIVSTGSPTDLNYRMRETAGAWKVIDVYYGAISQLTSRRWPPRSSWPAPGFASRRNRSATICSAARPALVRPRWRASSPQR